MNPLVSLVTPVYNQGEFVADTIDSVLAQDYQEIEYLVLDDGSTDRTPDVLATYAGRVRTERHSNMGQSRTLNKGWGLCSGEYLGYISGDDRLLPNAISTLVRALQQHPDVVVAYCDFNLIDAAGRVVGSVQSPDWDRRRQDEELICHPGPGALFRRSAFEAVGGWNPSLRRIPDFEFWLRMAQRGPFLRVPQILADCRLHPESTGLRPIAYSDSMEIVRTMHARWVGDPGPGARVALQRAHHKAAISHAQSGRVGAAISNYLRASAYRPRMLLSHRAWISLIRAFMMRYGRHMGAMAARLR